MGSRFSTPFQTVPGAHPVSFKMGAGLFPEVKRPGRDVDHPPPSSAEAKERVELYLFFPSGSLWPVLGWTLVRWKGRSLFIESHLCRSVLKLVLFMFEMFSNFPCGGLHVHRTITRISEKAYSVYNGYSYLRIPSFRYYGLYRVMFRCPAKMFRNARCPFFFPGRKNTPFLSMYTNLLTSAQWEINICRSSRDIIQSLTGRNRKGRGGCVDWWSYSLEWDCEGRGTDM